MKQLSALYKHKLMFYSLKSWLATSQKKHCEICGHRYTFTKGGLGSQYHPARRLDKARLDAESAWRTPSAQRLRNKRSIVSFSPGSGPSRSTRQDLTAKSMAGAVLDAEG